MIYTDLELAAIALINEVESNIRLGVPMTTALVNAADNFRKKQLTFDPTGSGLINTMFKQVQQVEAQVIKLRPKPLTLLKND